MTLKPELSADGESHRTAANRSAAAVTGDTFVINLCSSTTPMALVHPETPELKRFKFFVSRRLEDGRERFRLHMGHFETLEEAEDWLSVVRDIYPGAWAGEAPGKRLRSGSAATTPSQSPATAAPPSMGAPIKESFTGSAPPTAVSPAASLPAASAEAPAIGSAWRKEPPPAPPQSMAAPPHESSAKSAPPIPLSPSPSPPAAAAEPAAIASAWRKEPPPAPQAAPSQKAVAGARLAPQEPPPAPMVERRRESVAAPRPGRRAPKMPLSNVREVLAALDERDTQANVPPSAAPRTAASAAQIEKSLTDTQVMQILEARSAEETPRTASDASGGIPLLRPDDSGTRRALKSAVEDNAAVAFAVQLQWSVESMALEKVPPLAIFSAYTLYTVEGKRDGRTWYGLRLGFFSDANAARQVAQYVRSDFASVAVVPVSSQERTRAASAHKSPAPSFAEVHPATQSDEIKLLDADRASAPRTSPAPAGAARTGSAAARAAATRSKALRSKEPGAQRKGPYSLEETLEILGAGSLEIDNGRGELLNDTGVRHLKVEVRKNSPFQRLLTRLTERVRKS
jgi:hypothetical protein